MIALPGHRYPIQATDPSQDPKGPVPGGPIIKALGAAAPDLVADSIIGNLLPDLYANVDIRYRILFNKEDKSVRGGQTNVLLAMCLTKYSSVDAPLESHRTYCSGRPCW